MTLPKITSAMLILTHACNLKCRYCFVHQEPCHMTLETAMDAAKFLIKNAEEVGQVPSINFFGGEPTLKWDEIIVPLTNWIRNEYGKPFDLGITTNGTLLNDSRIQYLKINGISILLSIDGDKETQDYNRPYHNGDGSFDSLLPLLPKIVLNFKNITFRSTTIPLTCHHVFDNIMFAKQHGFSNFFVVPNVFEEWNDSHKKTLESEMRKYTNYCIDEYRTGKEPIYFSQYDEAFKDIKMINYAYKHQIIRDMKKCQACGKCGLGSGKFASIHPNGNVYGCQEMTSNDGEEGLFYIGNIYTGIIDKLRENLMARFDNNHIVGLNCDTCKLTRVCDGGCVANNYMITGSLSHAPDIYCWWKQLLLNEAIYMMDTLGSEKNELFKKRWEALK